MYNIEEILSHYGITGNVVKINDGPVIKQIEFAPAVGTKLKNITTCLADIQREMGVNSLRVEQAENSTNISFEVPQEEPQTVDLKSVFASATPSNHALPLCLGADIGGQIIWADLAKMPHLLLAGATGSGKSVGLNTFILSLIKFKKPSEFKLVLIDPKRIEFSIYNNQSYMLFPVVTDNAEAKGALDYLVAEMEKRYKLLEESLCRNISEYNNKCAALPYIVCVVDEFADLIMFDKNVSTSIQLLAQKARACGIHLILSTQRPSSDVITGTIKANFPTRLAYKVSSAVDSRIILDTSGAEDLIGRGDSLFLSANGDLKRVQGAYMKDADIENMLSPYRTTIKPINLANQSADLPIEKKANSNKSIFRKAFEAWSNLRQRDKKVVISALSWLFSLLLGFSKKKR